MATDHDVDTNAQKPRRFRQDGQEVEQHDILKQAKIEEKAAAKVGVTKVHRGLRVAQCQFRGTQ